MHNTVQCTLVSVVGICQVTIVTLTTIQEPPQVPLVAVTIPPKVLTVNQPVQQVIPALAARLPQASVLLVIMQEVTHLLALFVTLVIVLTIPRVLALAINTATQVPDIRSV